MKLAVAVGVFGLVSSLSLYDGVLQARAERDDALKVVLCFPAPVSEQPLPPILIDPEDENATLAYKNKNPLNVKALKHTKWKGQVGVDRFGHAVFEDWEYGVRSAALVLRAYAREHGIDTVKALVTRFAEGNQKDYIAYLCKRLGVEPEEPFDLVKRMPELLRHMSRYESGGELPEKYFVAYDLCEKL